MSEYTVALKPLPNHALPPLLDEFGQWLAAQPHPSLGYFDSLATGEVPLEWSADAGAQLQRDGFVFGQLPDGSLLALVTPRETTAAAVVLLGSEGDAKTVANSLEAFLIALSKGDTGVEDLDDDEAAGRAAGGKALKTWLEEHDVRAPKVKPFDFPAYLAGATSAPPSPRVASASTPEIAELPPIARELALFVGRRADDAELKQFVEIVLGEKVPSSTNDAETSANVVADKHGVELSFSHDVEGSLYPPIQNGRAYIPYLTTVWLKKEGVMPYGLKMKQVDNGFGKMVSRLDEDEALRALGEPSGTEKRLKRISPVWLKPLDAERAVWLRAEFFDGPTLTISNGTLE